MILHLCTFNNIFMGIIVPIKRSQIKQNFTPWTFKPFLKWMSWCYFIKHLGFSSTTLTTLRPFKTTAVSSGAMAARCFPEVNNQSKTSAEPQTSSERKRIDGRGRVLTLRPPVLSLMGVRKGSKIMWLVSMLTGDCLFPTEQRFQAELTSPQKDGTATEGKTKGHFKHEWTSALTESRLRVTWFVSIWPPDRRSSSQARSDLQNASYLHCDNWCLSVGSISSAKTPLINQ